MNRPRSRPAARHTAALLVVLGAVGCESAPPRTPPLQAQEALSAEDFTHLVERISEPGGYFDTDNLISNEAGYLNVVDALGRLGLEGGAYVGVGPDQNFSYVAELEPSIAFIVDVRRDNLLHHLLLKSLVERSETRVELLSALHGVPPPHEPAAWRHREIDDVVAYVDSAWTALRGTDDRMPDSLRLEALHEGVAASVSAYGVPLSDEDLATIRRFHTAFIESGLGLRFTSFGRAPRPYYPTFRQLVLATDVDGDRASYLATPERYAVVRELHLANRIVPVVGDLAGRHALVELGHVLREAGLELTALYASNVEFYLWRERTFERWVDNVASLPASDDAVIIRSYFPSFGRAHPSAVAGYYATQTLQPVATLAAGGFGSYWEVVTRDAIGLRR